MSMNSSTLYNLAREIINFLSRRTHTEKPHIGVLGPAYNIMRYAFGSRPQSLDESSEMEEFFEEIDPFRRIVPYAFGYYADFKPISEKRNIITKFSFYIRVAPREAEAGEVPESERFRHIVIDINIQNESIVFSKITILNGKEKKLIEKENYLQLTGDDKGLEGWFEVPISTISKRWPSINSVLVHDLELARALSTPSKTSSGKFVLVGRGRPLSSLDYFITYAFAIKVNVQKIDEKVRVSVILYNCGGKVCEKKSNKTIGSLELAKYMIPSEKDRINRWSTEYLLEVKGSINWNGYNKGWSWKTRIGKYINPGLRGFFPINCLAVEENNCIILRDWHIDTETILKVEADSESAEVAVTKLSKKYKYDLGGELVAEALRHAFPKVKSLYTFQRRSLEKGLTRNKNQCIILTSRTAGGKTLGFLLPLLVKIVENKIIDKEPAGTKAILLYPTIALCYDQAQNIFRMVWHLNNFLIKRTKHVVSLGILHGETKSRKDLAQKWYEEKVFPKIRLKCPLCGNSLMLKFEEGQNDQNWVLEKIHCSNKNCLVEKDSALNDLLNKTLRITRDSIYSDPPDILITNPDMINVRLIYEPESQSILGRKINVCTHCGWTSSNLNTRKCKRCGSSLAKLEKISYPGTIVIDEAHLLRGSFGAQVSHVITRLEQAIRKLNNLPTNWRPLYFLSSATLNNPIERARELLTAEKMEFELIEADYSNTTSGVERERRKIHVFIMPKAYSPVATITRIIQKIYSNTRWMKEEEMPSTLVFVNRIAESNSIVHTIRDMLSNLRLDRIVDGHTTDYGSQRGEVEKEFTEGHIKILIATRGLEVGVDFDIITIGCIYGMPYYVSDYVQRIGRIGRNKNSLIFNIFLPDKPIDHFFFRNWRILSDLGLREKQLELEAYRINRRNLVVLRRSAIRALFDYLSTSSNAHLFYHSGVTNALVSSERKRIALLLLKLILQPGENGLQDVNILLEMKKEVAEDSYLPKWSFSTQLRAYILSALSLKDLPQDVEEEINRVISEIYKNILSIGSVRTLKQLIREFTEIFQLWSIRNTERNTLYEFTDLQNIGFNKEECLRTRNLSYSFRHSIKGQIISYRSYFFVVDSLEGFRGLKEDPEKMIWR